MKMQRFGDASRSRGMPRINSQPPKARGEAMEQTPLQLQKEPTLLTDPLISDSSPLNLGDNTFLLKPLRKKTGM